MYHATNAKETAIITPKQSLFLRLKSNFTRSKPKSEQNTSLKLLDENLSLENKEFKSKENNQSDENSTNENF